MMKQKIKEHVENNLVFCIDRRKTFAVKSVQKSIFRNPSRKNKIGLFSTSVFYFCLFRTMTKETVYLNDFERKLNLDNSF